MRPQTVHWLTHHCRLQLAVLAAVVASMYTPVLVGTYGFADDYLFLDGFKRGHPGIPGEVNISNGRPITQAIQALAFGAIDDVGELRWLRVLAILGIATAGAIILLMAVTFDRGPWEATGLAIAFCALPCSQIVAAWATMLCAPIAVVLALVSAWSAQRTGRWGWPATALAASVLIYQSGAMAYWLAIAIMSTGRDELRPRWRTHATVLAVGLIVAFGAFVAGRPEQQVAARKSLSLELPTTMSWFVGRVLPHSLAPITLRPLPVLAGLTGLVLLAGLWRQARARRRPVMTFAGWLALIPLAYLPNLAVGPDATPTFRTQIALMPTVLVLLVHAAKAFAGRTPLVRQVAGAVLCLLLVTEVPLITTLYIVKPQEREWRITVAAVAQAPAGTPLAVAQSSYSTNTMVGAAPDTVFDEFGLTSSTYPWSVGPMVRLAHRETTGEWGDVRVVLVRRGIPEALHLIDFQQLLRE